MCRGGDRLAGGAVGTGDRAVAGRGNLRGLVRLGLQRAASGLQLWRLGQAPTLDSCIFNQWHLGIFPTLIFLYYL